MGRTKICPVLGNYALGEKNSIVILDNATIHHSEEIVDLIKETGAQIIYLPPYSPDLNPIELMFGQYKVMLKRFFNEKLSVAHTFALQSVTSVTVNNYFYHCGIPGVKNLSGEDEDMEATFAVVVAAVAAASTTIMTAAVNFIKTK